MMNSICAVCAAGEFCQCYGACDEGNYEQCDEVLAVFIEDERSEYRKAWVEYIKKFED